ncbi:MAG: helix-turn-helix transcriptional regulator [Bacteroidota bacterium]
MKRTQSTEGERLTEILHLKKISQSEFARTIGTSTSNVSNWKKNNVLPEGNIIKVILEKLPDISIRYWFIGDGEPLRGQSIEVTDSGDNEEILIKSLGQKELRIEKQKIWERLAMKAVNGLLKILEAKIPENDLEEMKKEYEIERLKRQRSK